MQAFGLCGFEGSNPCFEHMKDGLAVNGCDGGEDTFGVARQVFGRASLQEFEQKREYLRGGLRVVLRYRREYANAPILRNHRSAFGCLHNGRTMLVEFGSIDRRNCAEGR